MAAGTSAAMAGVAASQAAVAAGQAHQARIERCKLTMPNFNAQQASVTEMREYAECVETLYPAEVSDGTIVALKVLFAIGLVAMAVGAWRERRYGLEDMALAGVCWFIFAPVVALFGGGIIFGIRWLFS